MHWLATLRNKSARDADERESTVVVAVFGYEFLIAFGRCREDGLVLRQPAYIRYFGYRVAGKTHV